MILCVGTTPTVQRTMAFARVLPDGVNRAAEVLEYASGKSVNVAKVARLLGAEVVAVGFAGGARGEFLLGELNRAGVANDFVRVAAQTRLCTTVIDRATGEVTELVEESAAASPAEWADLGGRVDRHLARAAVVVLSGTLAGGPAAPQDFCARWVGRAPAVVVDAKGEALRRALAAAGERAGERGGAGFVAKLNAAELAETLGEPLPDPAAVADATRLLTPPGAAMVVTMGKAGAVACAGGRVWRAIAPAVEVVSPIGSGDAFAAGVAVGIARGLAFEDQVRLGMACGVANATNAFSGHVDPREVDRLLGEVLLTAG